MNCTSLLATTQSHHIPYLDISQTQQPYFESSKELNTIHAYGTLQNTSPEHDQSVSCQISLEGLKKHVQTQVLLLKPTSTEDAMRLADEMYDPLVFDFSKLTPELKEQDKREVRCYFCQ